MGLCATRQTKLSEEVHPALAIIVLWVAIVWLNMVEGSQASFVGLPPVNKDLYENSHPLTFQCTKLCHQGDNLDRYLMGRQFLVLLIVFATNMAGAPLSHTAQLWGLPQWLLRAFLDSGLAMIVMTTIVGQLTSQVNASHCMLDYVNNYFAVFTLWVSLIVEFSGLLHASYFLQVVVAKMAGKPVESHEAPRTTLQSAFFWGRVLLSLTLLAFGLAVTLESLLHGQTTLWQGVSPAVGIVLFFLLQGIIGMLEGMQIAFFAVTKLPKARQGNHPWAKRTCKFLFAQGGRHLPGFMIGRQVCVTLCFFMVARVTTTNVDVQDGQDTIMGVSDAVQEFFNTGLLAAVVTTILGSIAFQLVASAFPIAFLSFPPVYLLLRICIWLEASGIFSAAWVLAMCHKKVAGFQVDEVYIGTPEERAARQLQDQRHQLQIQPGHPRKIQYTPGRHELSTRNWDDTEIDLHEEDYNNTTTNNNATNVNGNAAAATDASIEATLNKSEDNTELTA